MIAAAVCQTSRSFIRFRRLSAIAQWPCNIQITFSRRYRFANGQHCAVAKSASRQIQLRSARPLFLFLPLFFARLTARSDESFIVVAHVVPDETCTVSGTLWLYWTKSISMSKGDDAPRWNDEMCPPGTTGRRRAADRLACLMVKQRRFPVFPRRRNITRIDDEPVQCSTTCAVIQSNLSSSIRRGTMQLQVRELFRVITCKLCD